MSAYAVGPEPGAYRPGLDASQWLCVGLAALTLVIVRLRRAGVPIPRAPKRHKPFALGAAWDEPSAARHSPLTWWSRHSAPVGRHRRPGVYRGQL